ncbi:MAG TPA: ABC transporter permease subunit [Candidatus Eisenbacteria bacterium]|nr:ABC transporter permease subunit [Candidatus Eisenbacteria bacterium]
MIPSFRSEWLRLRKRPAIWIMAALLLVLLLTFVYVLYWVIMTYPPKGMVVTGTTPAALKRVVYPASWLHTVLGSMTGLGGAIALIIGVLAAGSEYTWGTVKTLLTQGPGRLRVLAGKAAALELALLLLAAAMLAVGAAASAVLVSVDGATSTWPSVDRVPEALGAAWLILTLHAGLGFALAILFRQSALAIGVGLVYTLVVEGLVLGLLSGAELFKPVISALPGPNASGLLAAFPLEGPLTAAPLMGVTQASLVVAAYIALSGLVAALVFRARDVG